MYKSRTDLIILLMLTVIVTISNNCTAFAEDTKVLINIPSRTLDVINNGKTVKVYPVGVGKPSFPTPTGNFKVITKIVNPGWENPYKPAGESKIRPGRSNPLGTRWIGFYKNEQGEYGMHGTNRPFSVGKYSSHGCVRMKIRDAEDLFSKVDLGTVILVRNYTNKVTIKNGKILVRKYPNAYNLPIKTKDNINEQLSLLTDKYNLKQDKLNKLNSINVGSSLVIGELIETKSDPGIYYKITDAMAKFD